MNPARRQADSEPGGGLPDVAHRGSVGEVARLAYPVVLTNLSMTAMGFVDTAMVGRLGPTELGAVGFAGIWIWTFVVFFFGLATGVQTFVSQADGAGRPREAGGWAWQCIYLITPPMILVAISLGFVLRPGLALLAPSLELQDAAALYVVPRLFGMPAVGAAVAIASFFRGLGDTHTPLYAAIFANVVNAVLNYGLIFGRLGLPELGVVGAGIGTSVAEWTQLAVLLFFFRRSVHFREHGARLPRPDWRAMRRFVATSAPIGGQWLIGMASWSVFTTVIARMGDASMAASQAFLVLLSFSFMQMSGISTGSSTLMGRYIGAGDRDSARRSFWSAEKLAMGLSVLVAALFFAFPELLLRIFTSDPAVLELGRPLVRLGAVFQVFDAIGIVAEGSLRGAGDTTWPFVIHSVSAWALQLPLAYLLGVTLGGGLTGAWLGSTLYVAVLGLVLVARFTSGAWERIEI